LPSASRPGPIALYACIYWAQQRGCCHPIHIHHAPPFSTSTPRRDVRYPPSFSLTRSIKRIYTCTPSPLSHCHTRPPLMILSIPPENSAPEGNLSAVESLIGFNVQIDPIAHRPPGRLGHRGVPALVPESGSFQSYDSIPAWSPPSATSPPTYNPRPPSFNGLRHSAHCPRPVVPLSLSSTAWSQHFGGDGPVEYGEESIGCPSHTSLSDTPYLSQRE